MVAFHGNGRYQFSKDGDSHIYTVVKAFNENCPGAEMEITENEPFKAFKPRFPSYQGPLFGRLNIGNVKRIHKRIHPVRNERDRTFHLPRDLVISWVSLELNLRAICRAMLAVIPSRWHLLPTAFHLPLHPKQKGYDRIAGHKTSEAALASLIATREAFDDLMAATTMFYMICKSLEAENPSFSWREAVEEKTQIHPQWLSDLEESIVGDLELQRRGGRISIPPGVVDHPLLRLLPVLEKANMTLVIYWGEIVVPPVASKTSKDLGLVPTETELVDLLVKEAEWWRWKRNKTAVEVYSSYFQAQPHPPAPVYSSQVPRTPLFLPSPSQTPSAQASALRRAEPLFLSSPSPTPFPEERPPPVKIENAPRCTTPEFPPVQPGSGQRPGEHWSDFFTRRQESNARKLTTESAKQKASRLARQIHAEKNMPPGRKGANVFRWEDLEGFRVRRPAGFSNYDTLWEMYPDAQRRYDGFYNEWDVCTEFGDDEDPDPEDEFYAYWLNGAPPVEVELPPDDEEPDHQEGEFASRADLERLYEEDPQGETEDLLQQGQAVKDQYEIISEPFEDNLYFRFGYSPDVVPPTSVSPSPYDVPLPVALLTLGDGRHREISSFIPLPSPKIQNEITEFLGHLWTAQALHDIPSQLLDVLRPQARAELWFGHGNGLRLRMVTLDGTIFYLFRRWVDVDPESAPLELGLQSSVATLEVLRRQFIEGKHVLGPDLDSVINFILDRGIAFNTFIHSTRVSPPPPERPLYSGLGFRKMGYKPNSIDYRAYTSIRNNFLRTTRCRAALMAGGLIGRIARDIVPYDNVYYGPSDAVFETGFCLSEGQRSPAKYWDDRLTGHEIDLICGVYQVYTGMRLSLLLCLPP